MTFSPLIDQLIDALRRLPGVGPKSAQRMAFHLLERDREGGRFLSTTLAQAMQNVGHCQQCRTLCETAVCALCTNEARDRSLLCVVETPSDVIAIEHTSHYRGYYFVLMGHISPLDGIGPDDLGIDLLLERCLAHNIRELILATNLTVEGEATAHYIAHAAKQHAIKTTRIAHGVPSGGELEYIDGNTLARALEGRAVM